MTGALAANGWPDFALSAKPCDSRGHAQEFRFEPTARRYGGHAPAAHGCIRCSHPDLDSSEGLRRRTASGGGCARLNSPRRCRRIWLPLALAAGAYFAMPTAIKRAFAPQQRDATAAPRDFGLPQEPVSLNSVNGTRLHGWFIPVEGSAPAIIVLHGWGSNAGLMLPLAPHLHAAGLHTLFLDARNHGKSDHDSFSSLPRFAEDLDVAAQWLRGRSDVISVGVIGHSVGAGAAILCASRSDQFEAVVSVSSFAHPAEMMRRQLSAVPKPALELLLKAMQRVIGHQFDDFAPRLRIGLVRAPLMLVHGDADTVVPIESLNELAAAHPGAEVLMVDGGTHSDLEQFESHVSEITAFLLRHLHPVEESEGPNL